MTPLLLIWLVICGVLAGFSLFIIFTGDGDDDSD